MVHKYTQMQIIEKGESTRNADYRDGRIYTKCRLSGWANLHEMQIIGMGESTRNADYREGRIYTKCRLSEGGNLHQMQIIRREELTSGREDAIFCHEETRRDSTRQLLPAGVLYLHDGANRQGRFASVSTQRAEWPSVSLGTPSNASPLLVPEGGGEGDTVLYRAAEGELVGVLEVVTDGDTAREGADTEVGDLLE